jgi:hypothetical protein
LYLTASASAEFIADIALCPFEAVKVRMQTTIPPFAKGTFDGISTIVAKEGTSGLYKGLYPLWGRQIPYTMMKFASFETIVEMIYERLPGQKSDYGKGAQTAVSFTGGYLAGILCAIVSHPADVMVSKLNANRQAGEAFGAAMGRIYKDIGFAGLWNGLPVRIVMVSTFPNDFSNPYSPRRSITDLVRVLVDWNVDRITMDDLRKFHTKDAILFSLHVLGLLQDLHGTPNHGRCSTSSKELEYSSRPFDVENSPEGPRGCLIVEFCVRHRLRSMN